nr:hypothetical protein CKG001_10300 [Bdellovibrio sp. CKG001]
MASFFVPFKGQQTKNANSGVAAHTCAANRYAICSVVTSSNANGTIVMSGGFAAPARTGMTFFIGPGETATPSGANVQIIVREFATSNVG